jgi:glycosyltransferase involved in cell wall biosynthesis
MKSKITVLYVSHTGAWAGGAEVVLEQVIHAARNAGYSPQLICPPGILGTRLQPLCDGVATIRMPSLYRTLHPIKLLCMAVAWLRVLVHMTRLIARVRPSMIHVNSGVSALTTVLPAALTGTPMLWHQHDIVPNRRINRIVLRVCARSSSVVVATSRAVAESLISLGISETRVQVLYPRVRSEFFESLPPRAECRKRLGLPGDKRVITVIGRLVPRKGQRIFLETLSMLVSDQLIHGLIVGDSSVDESAPGVSDAYRDELLTMANQPQLRGRVGFIAHRNDIATVLGATDVLIVPSTAEPFGIVILEAHAAGVPVVAFASAGPLELIEHGVSGLLCPPGDAHELAKATKRLLGDDQLRRKIIETARTRVHARYSERSLIAHLNILYSGILEIPPSVAPEETLLERTRT